MSQNSKKIEGGPLGIFLKKRSRNAEKLEGGPFGLVRYCMLRGKPFWFSSRYCQELQDVMVRSYQESHVPKKNFVVKIYLARKNLKGSQQK